MTETLRTGLAAKFSLRAVSRAALGCLLGAALLSTGTPARAGDSDDVPIDTKIFRGILEGFGLRRDGAAINYEERAPLVIPPSHALPPPERIRRRDCQKSGLAERSRRATAQSGSQATTRGQHESG